MTLALKLVSDNKENPSLQKQTYTPEQKDIIKARKGVIQSTPAFEAAKAIRYISPDNLFTQKPTKEQLSAVVISTVGHPADSKRLDSLQQALLGIQNNGKSTKVPSHALAFSPNTGGASTKHQDNPEGNNHYLMDGIDWRELAQYC